MNQNKDSNTEVQILEAAKNVFQRKGMAGARMQEIANEAGINKAMLHYYYRSKEMLFNAVFKKAFALLAPELNHILNDNAPIVEKVKSFTANYTNFLINHPYLPNFIITEINRNPQFISDLLGKNSFLTIDNFKAQLQTEIDKGLIRPITADQLFVNIIALNIFPFLAKPLIKGVLKKDDKMYLDFVEERKTQVSNFIINAIQCKS